MSVLQTEQQTWPPIFHMWVVLYLAMAQKNEPPSSLIQISEPYVPKKPKLTLSGFPDSPVKSKLIR